MSASRVRTVLTLLALLSFLGRAAPVAAASRPNIVFILTDDQRWDTTAAEASRIERVQLHAAPSTTAGGPSASVWPPSSRTR